MQKSHDRSGGLATHSGPESCGAARKGGVEGLTGERAGRVLEPGDPRTAQGCSCPGTDRGGRPYVGRDWRQAGLYLLGALFIIFVIRLLYSWYSLGLQMNS